MKRKFFIYEVRINWENDPGGGTMLAWLKEQKKKAERDWSIDMHGGRLDYISFWFHDAKFAVYAKLAMGGV